MKIKKTSWHYNLVKHKYWLKEVKPGNKAAMGYIEEVVLAIWVNYLILPITLLLFSGLFLPFLDKFFFLILFAIASFPLGQIIILEPINFFLSSTWKELKIVE